MDGAQVRVVVGEGDSPRKGLLRFVLEGDGYDVVGEATTPASLARLVADHQPDVVVLDDVIGATAPQVVREISPRTKIVLVWPGAVVPIGGDARVEPSQVLRQLGSTVATVAAGIAGLTSIERPEWIEKVRKDPATLREMLERRGGLPDKRPSVTELQRRGQRLHPTTPAEPDGVEEREDEAMPIVPLVAAGAAAATGDDGEPTIELPEGGEPVLRLPTDDDERGDAVVPITAGAAIAKAKADAEATERNRRLGAIALGGAAVVGAIVFALSLGGSRVSTDIIVAEGPRATIAPGPPIDSGIDEPEPGEEPDEEPGEGPGGDPGEGTPPGVSPSTSDPSPGPTPPDGGTEPPPEVPDGGTEPPPVIPPSVNAPGRSGLNNPHEAPPGQTPDPNGSSSSTTGPAGNGARHWADGLPGQAGTHGQGIEHGKGLDKPEHHHKS